jgi:S1-C subfamily serine protease
MNHGTIWRTTALILLVILLLVCVGAVGVVAGMSLQPLRTTDLIGLKPAAAAPAAPVTAEPLQSMPRLSPMGDEEEQLLQAIYQAVAPSVVHIRVVQPATASNTGYQYEQDTPEQGEGSGFILDVQGHIATNYHVVQDATKIEVRFFDGTTLRARYVGGDADADLAIVQVTTDSTRLRPVRIADSDQVFVGQRAIAIGSPFGQEWTMTTGIVSALGRTMPSGTSQYAIPEMIQTDAAINPGNSGGPLLNAQGEVIGVNSMIMSRSNSSAGVGFAVPSNIVRLVAPSLIENGSFAYAWMGVQGVELSLDLCESMGLPAETRGVMIVNVVPGSPAEYAGLRGSTRAVQLDGVQMTVGGDVVTAADGRPIDEMGDVIIYLVKTKRPGDQMTLTILRDGQAQTVNVTLAERPRTALP